jgi:hypothetical protein
MKTLIILQIATGQLFNTDLINVDDFLELLFRLLFSSISVFVLVRLIYYRASPRKDYLFTFALLGTVVFLICYLLSNVKLQLGFALGLFAVFGILRYRTFQMPIREMSYLFTIIALSVINALANKKISYAELLLTNLAVLGLVFLLENIKTLKHESVKLIIYEKIDLIAPERRDELMADLEKRTGLKIHRIEIGRVNFLQDTARIQVYYYDLNPNAAEDSERPPDSDD